MTVWVQGQQETLSVITQCDRMYYTSRPQWWKSSQFFRKIWQSRFSECACLNKVWVVLEQNLSSRNIVQIHLVMLFLFLNTAEGVHCLAQGHCQDMWMLMDKLSVVGFKELWPFSHRTARYPAGHPVVWIGAVLITEISPFSLSRTAGMSESCYCRLGGLFLLEVDSRWEKGWVSLLMGPMIKTTCVCVWHCSLPYVCITLRTYTVLEKPNTHTIRRSNILMCFRL